MTSIDLFEKQQRLEALSVLIAVMAGALAIPAALVAMFGNIRTADGIMAGALLFMGISRIVSLASQLCKEAR